MTEDPITLAPHPHVGCVTVLPAHDFNRLRLDEWWQNPNRGWTWFQARTIPQGDTLWGPVFRKRKEAMADAKRVFPKVDGWKKARFPANHWHAEVREA